VDPVTTPNPRMPEEEMIWVIKILSFISWIYLVFLRIFFITSIYSLSTSGGIIVRIYQYTHKAIKNREKLKANQPVQQEDSNQSNQSNSTIQELKLTLAATEDPKFSTKTLINWIQQIFKRKRKIFNKQLFKPHSDLSRFQFLKDLHWRYRRLFSTLKKTGEKMATSISQPIFQVTKSSLTTASSHSKIQNSQDNKRTKTDSPQHLKNTDPSIQKAWDPGRLWFLKSRLLLHHNIRWPNFKRRKINLMMFKHKRKKKKHLIMKFQESKQPNHLHNPVKIQHTPGYETKLFKNNLKININEIHKFKQRNKIRFSQDISLGCSSSFSEKFPYSFLLQNPLLINHRKHKKEKSYSTLFSNKLGEDPTASSFPYYIDFLSIFILDLIFSLLTYYLSSHHRG
jgi:hypothetical protein